MQPDNPALCAFYLEGMLAALTQAEPVQAYGVLQCLTAFLWRFALAAVPEYLRAPLLAALHGTGARLCGMVEPDAPQCKLAAAIERCAVTAWVLDGNDTYNAWVTQRPHNPIIEASSP